MIPRPAARSGRRRALVVTVERFGDPVYPRLRSAFADGWTIRRLLRRPATLPLGGFSCDWLSDPTAVELRVRVERCLREAASGDTVFLYLSTHASVVRGADGEPDAWYFAARDTQAGDLPRSGVAMKDVAAAIAACRATLFVVADTCYAGGLVKAAGVPGAGGRRDSPAEDIAAALGTPARTVLPAAHSESLLLSRARGVASVRTWSVEPVRLILTASGADSVTPAGNRRGRPSPFTAAFVEAVESGSWLGPAVHRQMFAGLPGLLSDPGRGLSPRLFDVGGTGEPPEGAS